jgi:hypothetical protein
MEAIKQAEAAILMKVEATTGVDAAPTGAEALRVVDYELTPLDGDVVDRNYIQPKGGATEAIRARRHRKLKFSVELAGSGDAETPPGFAACLLAGAMNETVVADTSVSYNPILRNLKTATVHTYVSGKRWALLGAMGGLSIGIQNGQVPKLTWDGVGAWSAAAAPVQPANAYANIVKGLILSKANTTVELGGNALILEKLDINLGNAAKWSDKPGYAAADIADHKVTGNIQFRWPETGWSPEDLEGQVLPFGLQHGTVAGNIVEITGANVQIMNPKPTMNDGVWDCAAELRFLPSGGGDDDIIITFK